MSKENKGSAICETVRAIKFQEKLKKLAMQRDNEKKERGK